MGQSQGSLADAEAFFAAYHWYISLAIILLSLALCVAVFLEARSFLKSVEPGNNTVGRRGRPASRRATLERALVEAQRLRKEQWREIGGWISSIITAGLIIPTLCLALFALSYGQSFAAAAFTVPLPECSCETPGSVEYVTLSQLSSLVIASVVTPEIYTWIWSLFGAEGTLTIAYNLDIAAIQLLYLAHKYVALRATWSAIQDFLLGLPRLIPEMDKRVNELKARIDELDREP